MTNRYDHATTADLAELSKAQEAKNLPFFIPVASDNADTAGQTFLNYKKYNFHFEASKRYSQW
jgi:hypothetical protein